jgi:NAD(P)-dependent dehydrogenase (short-subunit alcohol dehydrogenase family)
MSGVLAGKAAVITGGSTGIGLATAHRFLKEGASVVITGRRQAELDKAVEELGGDVIAVQADVSKVDDLDRLFARVRETRGRIDVLFANASIAPACTTSAPSPRTSWTAFSTSTSRAWSSPSRKPSHSSPTVARSSSRRPPTVSRAARWPTAWPPVPPSR